LIRGKLYFVFKDYFLGGKEKRERVWLTASFEIVTGF
jgi:hypothetical protein